MRRTWLALVAVLLVAGAAVAVLLVDPFGSDGDTDRDDARPVLRVGTEGTYAPFTFREDGELTGYDVEVMRAVGEEAGYDVEFVEGQFDSLFPALDAGRVDVIANQITVNPEREDRYLFTRPYTYSRGVVIAATDNDDVTGIDDIRGLTAAQSETSNWAQVARDAGARVESVDGFAAAADLIAQGRVDVMVNDNIAALDYLATTGSTAIEVKADVPGEVGRQALALRQDETGLRDRLDDALGRLADDGSLTEISERYFGADVSVEDGGDATSKRERRSTGEVLREAAGPMLWAVVKGTIPLTIVSFLAGLVIALAVALARMSSLRVLRWPARFYISVIRGTPLLVQLFIVFFGLPEIGVKLPGFVAACLALSLNVGGYAAEIIRGAILSVPRGQFEAAATIGMDYRATMRHVVLPQASRIAVPPLSNTLLSLVKDTSLASVVLVTELFRVARREADATFEYLPLYCLAALYFWIICFLLTLGQDALEKRLGRYVA